MKKRSVSLASLTILLMCATLASAEEAGPSSTSTSPTTTPADAGTTLPPTVPPHEKRLGCCKHHYPNSAWRLMRFGRVDRNDDRLVSKDEAAATQARRERWQKHRLAGKDADHDRTLEPGELKSDRRLDRLDLNDDQGVSTGELKTWDARRDRWNRRRWNRADKNDDGQLSHPEFHQARNHVKRPGCCKEHYPASGEKKARPGKIRERNPKAAPYKK